MNFILITVGFFLNVSSASGRNNDSLILGIAKNNGTAVTTHRKKLMFVDWKLFKTIFRAHVQHNPSLTTKRKASD